LGNPEVFPRPVIKSQTASKLLIHLWEGEVLCENAINLATLLKIIVNP